MPTIKVINSTKKERIGVTAGSMLATLSKVRETIKLNRNANTIEMINRKKDKTEPINP